MTWKMASEKLQNASSMFFTKDPNLLQDVFQLRSSDIAHMTRRLDAAAKSLVQISSSLDPTKDEVQHFISELGHCYIAASENTRVSRGLEKILGATGPHCEALVRKTLGTEVLQVLNQLYANGKDLKNVSTLLEHSRLVQGEMAQHVPILQEQLGDLYRTLLQPLPSGLNREDSEKLYYTVKISLQLFQQFPNLRQEAWVCLKSLLSKNSDAVTEDKLPPALTQIVNGVLAVLIKKSYAREVTLLAATAVSMVIGAVSAPHESAQAFFQLHSLLTDRASIHELKNLQLYSTKADDPHSSHDNHTAEIAVLRSILLGSAENVLCCEVRNSDPDSPLTVTRSSPSEAFLFSLFPLVCKLCDTGTEFQYLSFQLLSLWTQKLSSCFAPLAEGGRYISLLGKNSVILSETLKRVWLSLDSPVSGVSEFVVETLKILLELWNVEVKNGRSDYADLAEELMAKTIQVPWYARSRYKPLSLLIPYVDTDKLLAEKENLKSELLECMGASFLAALASDVYTAFLLSVRDKYREEEQAERWQKTWLPTVIAGLTSSDSLIRNKVCAYWLTSTLNILPKTGSLIQRHLEDRLQKGGDHSLHGQLLYAWVAVCRIIRTLGELDLSTLSEQLLTEAVYSDEEDICSEALSLLCTTQKKAEPLGEVEVRLLQSALPYCLKVDSAPFRQKLVTSLRKVFVRVRDSCSTAVKRKLQAHFVDCSLQFMDWLYGLMMNNLVPGSCFQRRRTCLDVIQAWFETVVFVETDGSKKGKAQGPTDVLMKYAEKKEWWNFFSSDNRTCLLLCVVDGADEIQESAVHILSKYFPWTLDRGSPDGTDLMSHLLDRGLALCDSPRAYENHSGALLVRLVYEKFVKEQGCCFQLQRSGSEGNGPAQSQGALLLSEAGERSSACVSFFTDVLLSRIESSLKASEADVLLASKSSPSHGLLQALCECFKAEQASSNPLDHADWQKILSQTVTLCFSVITLVLSILASGQGGNCPSFAQMGMALEQLVTDGAADQEVTSSLSPEFQLLLSWCWLNLKESCTCLGTVTAIGVTSDSDRGHALPVDTMENVGETFLKVLTHCRHRGAIEGCRTGFLQFSSSLMLSDDPVLSTIPANILNRVLCSLEKDEMTSSVTRRSAGVPIIVQTMLQAERRCRSNKLLQQTVSRLYAVASQPPSARSDQTQDQAPVHALNVLKAIFSDASLAGELLNHLGRMMELVICSFESSSWAVRNAATQLVSTLVTRMFGQRNRASLSCNMMTLQEWSAHFPELLAFVSRKLEGSLNGQGDVITAVQPSLFLVLTLLASLGPAAESSHCHRLTASLRATVLSAVSSPVYHLRELSATAVVALTPLDRTEDCVGELLSSLGKESSGSRNSNSVHGTLLCLEKLLSFRRVGHRVAEAVVQNIVSSRRLVSASEQCPLVRAKCVDVLKQAVAKLPSAGSLKEQLVETLVGVVFSSPSGHLQFGRALLISSASSLVVSLLQYSSQPTSIALQAFITACLDSSDVEVRAAILDCLSRNESTSTTAAQSKELQKRLWHQLSREADASCVIKISRLLVTFYLDRTSLHGDLDCDLCLDDLDELRSRFEKLANVQAALFPVEALVLSQMVGRATDIASRERLSLSLCGWSGRLAEFSQPCQNEDFRLAAAQALALAGQSALSFCSAAAAEKAMESWIASLVESCMVLLEETDSDIRRVVIRFVGKLEWKQKEPKISQMNANLCSKMFVAYLCDNFGHCPAVMNLLVSKLYCPGDLQSSLRKLAEARTHYLFEPEENTFFSERIHQQMDVYSALSKTHSNINGPSLLPSLLQELRTAIPVLQSAAAEQPVYNACGEPRVLALLMGTGMLVQLAAARLAGGKRRDLPPLDEQHQQMSSEVSAELSSLLQISNAHPTLATFLQSL